MSKVYTSADAMFSIRAFVAFQTKIAERNFATASAAEYEAAKAELSACQKAQDILAVECTGVANDNVALLNAWHAFRQASRIGFYGNATMQAFAEFVSDQFNGL